MWLTRPGRRTPWREWEGDRDDVAVVLYMRDGHDPGAQDHLAEQLRADGVALNLGDAYRRARESTLFAGWYGYLEDEDEPVECSELGETTSGEKVSEVHPCVWAAMVDAG